MSTEYSQNGHKNGVVGEEDEEERIAKRRSAITHTRPRDEQLGLIKKKVGNKADQTGVHLAFRNLAEAVSGRELPQDTDMVQATQVILDEFETLRETVDSLDEFMETYAVDKPRDTDEAWVKIVNAARNKSGNPNHSIRGSNEVALFVDNLETATGYSDRYCSQLIEQYGKEKRGTRWKKHERATAANNHSATRKQLIIDLDVWGEVE